MTDPATAPFAPPIDHDLHCAVCGYNLKGLSPDANCPECGQPVARTFTAELSHSDPAWLRHQARTMLLLIGLCLASYTPVSSRFGGSLLAAYLPLLAALIAAWACWRLATPEPAGLPDYGRGMLQRSLRLAGVLMALLSVAMPLQRIVRPIAWGTLIIIGVVCLIAAIVLASLFLLDLARRSRDPSLIRHARIVLWSLPLIHLTTLLGQIGFVVFLRVTDATGEWVFGIFDVFHFATGVAAYAAALLFGRMHEVLRAAANLAEARSVANSSSPRYTAQ